MNRHITLYHAPQSRSLGALALLEALGADYELKVLDLKAGEQRQDAYLAVNPMGKVPAIVHGRTVVTEQPAVYLYLAELYHEAGLSPAVGSALRGAYLRWMVFYGSCFEPALVDHSMQRADVPPSTSPYGDYDTVLRTLTVQLERGPYLLGETMTAADILWGVALTWITAFKLLPPTPRIDAYLERIGALPGVVRANEIEQRLLAARG